MDPQFPSISLTPKRDTGVLNFLKKYPDSDGRGVVIAVLDTGVDPAVEGLQVTTEGKPKVIGRFDCSGDGDVRMSANVTPDEEGFITGGSGRKMKIPSTWNNPSGQYRLGAKPLYELYTPKVKERVEAKRKEMHWDNSHRIAVGKATDGAFNYSSSKSGSAGMNGNENNDVDEKLELSTASAGGAASLEDKLEREEMEARIEVLDQLEKKYKDWGPILDVVLFRDSNSEYKVAIATTSDLTNVKLLSEYSISQSYMELTPLDKLTININVWDDGDIVEVVGLCGTHGTHVAAIAAGYFPNNPDLNGVAPGAQIVSLTIGDCRLGSMETGTSIARSIGYLMKNYERIDVINMSYGEHAKWGEKGRLGELIKEVIDKYGITWVCSGGNHGPALSTVGTPPWICSSNMIGVAAYVSPEMMSAEYSMRDKNIAMPYTWSSRGPTQDGHIGISVAAPGGAITSVPNFSLRSCQLMNGTSMAAPHVAGVVALLQSYSKVNGIAYSPFSIKRALENSASVIPGADPLSVGSGLVQVEPALDKLIHYSTTPELNVRFDVKIENAANSTHGIYIREPALAQNEYSVGVEPVFRNGDEIDPTVKLNFRLNLILVSSAAWLLPPDYLDLANMQRGFRVKVDLSGLPVGVHYGRIDALASNDPARGPIFSVHATAIVPLEPTRQTDFPLVTYEPGFIKRHFLLVPKGATQASITLRNESNTAARLVIHAMTLVQGQSCKHEEFYKMATIAAGDETVYTFRVLEGKVTELVIGRWWADAKDPIVLGASLTFKSFIVSKPEISISAADALSHVNISTEFTSEEITPSAPLKNQVCSVRPTAVKISSLSSSRDALPNSRLIYELVATYSFSVARATTLQVISSLLCDTLYEGEYESQLWMLFDNNKRFVGAGDAYPNKWATKLEKGDFTLRLHVRHEKRDMLEKFMNGFPNFQSDSMIPPLPLLLSFKLTNPIQLPVHQTPHEAIVQKKPSGWNATLKKGVPFCVTIGTYLSDKNLKQLPSNLQTHYFSGCLALLPKEDKRTTPLRLFLPDPPAKAKSEKSNSDIVEQMRDVKLNWIGKASKEDSFKLYNELLESHPTHMPLYTARLAKLETERKEAASNDASNPELIATIETEMKSLIEKIITLTDKDALLAYFGSKNADPKQKAQMERSRNAYVDALVKRGVVFGEDVQGCWTEAGVYFEAGDSKILDLTIKDAMVRGHFGRAAKLLLKSDESADKEKKLLEIYEQLEWKQAVWLMNENINFKSAVKEHRPF